MDISIHSSFLPFLDAEESLAFYRDTRGFEVKLDVGYGEMRWITVSSPQQPDTAIVQEPIAQGYGIRDAAVRDPAGNMLRIQELTQGEAQ